MSVTWLPESTCLIHLLLPFQACYRELGQKWSIQAMKHCPCGMPVALSTEPQSCPLWHYVWFLFECRAVEKKAKEVEIVHLLLYSPHGYNGNSQGKPKPETPLDLTHGQRCSRS